MKNILRNLFHLDTQYQKMAVREGELWGTAEPDIRLSWFDSPMIARYIHLAVSGYPDQDWLDYIQTRYVTKPVTLGLTVGCGPGDLDRLLYRHGLVKQLDGFDISPQAIQTAQENAQMEGLSEVLRYRVADANFLDQSDLHQEYDAIFVSMALHHFCYLEKCLDSLQTRLKKNGYLFANEFIGPNRFQWSEKQLDAVNRLLAGFPAELKRNLREPGKEKSSVSRPSVKYMEEHFAFESVCSERILPALRERFQVVEQKNYGGTILHLLFEAIMGNFAEETNREHAVLVRMAIECEKMLLDYGVLNHDHALLICQKVQ